MVRSGEQGGDHRAPRPQPAVPATAPLAGRPRPLLARASLARFPWSADHAQTARPADPSPADPSPADPSPADPSLAELTPGERPTEEPAPGRPEQGGRPLRAAGPGTGTVADAGRHADAPQSSAAELRELAEMADLLGELEGLVRDLGALIVRLMTAATSVGGRPVRTFTVPPELAELAVAHQELNAGQRALSKRFAAAGDAGGRAALRASLAALTERATRAVSAAAAVSFTSPARTIARGEPAVPSREEAGVQTTPAGAAPANGGPGRWKGASAPGRRLAPVAVALDAPDIDVAAHWATLVTPYVSTVKIGLYLRYGPAVVATVRGGSGVRVFLDLKLHDIPNTVAGAARAVAKLRPEILTVHAAGGAEMIKAAVAAAPETLVAGVTLLTSIGGKDLAELGVEGSVSDAVRRMAALAVGAGARGLVCSPQEVAAVRAEVGPDILLITPGIRLAGATSDDQARIATPEEALKAGADLLVIGRPITRAADPGSAAAAIAGSLRRAVPAS
jgi:orotidine-5'-phosphate decarboxylase